ncbi:MAG: glycosyltransferase family 4 protein [Planctomycetes bacterium]|nr:glycosyltransferase family 4 protein [Planctomycetota bacterium]
MRLLIVGEYPRANLPGSGLMAYHLAKNTPAEVLFITIHSATHGPPVGPPAHVRLLDLAVPDVYLPERLRPGWRDIPRYARKGWTMAYFLLRAFPAVLLFRPDIVNVYSVTDFPVGALARLLLGARLVVTFRGTDLRRLIHVRTLHPLYRLATDGVTCVSEDMVPQARRVLPRLDPVLAPPGVDVEEFGVHVEKENEILAVGRLRWQKGFDVLLRAAAKVLPAHPGYSLVVVGDGPLREELAGLAEDLGLSGRLVWIPALSRSEIARRMARARLLVLSSVSEGTPLVVIEALAAGTPVLATDVGGTRAVVGDCGVVVRPGDPEALAAGLSRLLADSGRLAALAEDSRKRAKSFDWKERVKPYHELFEELLRGRRRATRRAGRPTSG